jgi:hypothetical protein
VAFAGGTQCFVRFLATARKDKKEAVFELVQLIFYTFLNYLRGTNLEIGLLLNFGLKAEICRKVYDNDLKPNLKIRKSVSNP